MWHKALHIAIIKVKHKREETHLQKIFFSWTANDLECCQTCLACLVTFFHNAAPIQVQWNTRVQNAVSGKIFSAERSETVKRKECFRDRYSIWSHNSLCLLNRGTRNVLLCQWCSAQQAAYEGGKTIPYAQDVHNCWQALLAECLKRIADLKETKILPHPCSPSLGFMYLYVHMWKLCMLIGNCNVSDGIAW